MSRAAAALAAAVALLACLLAAPSALAKGGWGTPFELSKPGSLDYLDPELAFAPSGASAAAFGIEDVDTPGSGQAYLVQRSARGNASPPRAIAGMQEVLDLAYDGRSLQLLTGSAPGDQTCCSAAETVRVAPNGAVGKPQTLVGGLAGATEGRLLALAGGQMMAAVATERGVWVAQSTKGGRFGGQQRISDKGQEPQNLAAAWLGGGSTVVAWTAGTGTAGATNPRSIYYATGSASAAPHRTRVALNVPSGHRIDELTVARRGSGATLAWIESWFDHKGRYHSRAEAADLGAKAHPRALSSDNRIAGGVTFDADASGDQGLAWGSCTTDGACTVQAAGRGAGSPFGPTKTLGAIDPDESPTLTISPQGRIVIAWIQGGHPVASVGFGTPSVLSSTTFAHAATVDYGPKGEALAAWSQGTLNPSIVAAAFH